jgi:signal transduction histidine kinase
METIGLTYFVLGVLLLVVATLTACITSLVWRLLIKHDRLANVEKLNMMRCDMDYHLKRELQQTHLEHQKQRLVAEKQTRKALNKVDLVYAILHDVQAVLQGLSGYQQIMLDSNLTLPKEEEQMVNHEVSTKTKLLTEMVDCSIETLQYENLGDVPFDDEVLVNTFCQDMFEACRRYLKNNKVDLTVETALPDDYVVKTNMGYLRKVFKNLLICSMEYTNEGYIKMAVTEDAKGGLLRFVLSDTGLGIPDDVLEHVFERLPNDNITNKITGVRLRIAYALVHLLGGTIYVDTQYTPGTSIVFTVAMNRRKNE